MTTARATLSAITRSRTASISNLSLSLVAAVTGRTSEVITVTRATTTITRAWAVIWTITGRTTASELRASWTHLTRGLTAVSSDLNGDTRAVDFDVVTLSLDVLHVGVGIELNESKVSWSLVVKVLKKRKKKLEKKRKLREK